MTSSSTSTAAPCPGDIGKPSEKAYTGPVPDVLPAQRYSRTTNSLRTAQKYPLFYLLPNPHVSKTHLSFTPWQTFSDSVYLALQFAS